MVIVDDGSFVFLGGMTILLMILSWLKFKFRPKEGSKWASFFKKRDILSKTNNGLIIYNDKRISDKLSYQHLAVIAPTGQGKTTKFTIPNLIGMKDYSIVVTDPSGELYQKTAGYLKSQNINIIRLAPFDTNTTFFNPIANIKTLSEAKQLAKTILFQMSSPGNEFWAISAGTLLTAVILLAVHKKKPTFIFIRKLLARSKKDLTKIIDKDSTPEIQESYSTYKNSFEETSSGILVTTISGIELFSDENIERVTSAHALDFDNLRNKRTVLYLIIPEDKIRYSSSFTRLFYSQLFSYSINNSKGLPIYFILEEFANIGKIPDFSEVINVARKRNISFTMILQDLEQVKSVYKDEAKNILSGATVSKLFYPGLGPESADYVSHVLGKRVNQTKSKNRQANDILENSENTRDEDKPLLSADKIRCLPTGSAIFVTGNKAPISIKKVVPFYENKKLTSAVNFSEKESDK
ncbi:type IV secretory system conjugative DNA transfer family protein [bacterium]|nr:type IV secretory system conjugative DNA transfer family protein [bacterium]